jgi:hypothetical protein
MSKLEVDAIEPQSGTTLTLGASGDAVALGSGASVSGLTLSDNILFNTASKGIYLGVTTATASNLLDDYEEGTFTPGCFSYEGTPTILDASYTKIGRMVYGAVSLTLDGTSDGSTFRITGFPFTISANTWGGSVVYTNASTTENIYPLFNIANNNLYIYKPDGASHTYNSFGNDKNIRIIFMYETA